MIKQTVGPSKGGPGNFKNLATSQEDEDAFHFVKWRNVPKPNGILGSTAHMVKGALGAGILEGHVAYRKAGVAVAVPVTLILGVYIGYCLYLLVKSAQILNKRTRVPNMTYSEVGEAAVACCPNYIISKLARPFRYLMDVIICINLFGTCAIYQIIIAKIIKQLAENRQAIYILGTSPAYPNLHIYVALLVLPIILICLIMHLKWLTPFSFAANCVSITCTGVSVHYALQRNSKFANMVPATSLNEFLQYTGMQVFSMSCVGIIIPIENNMKNPKDFNIVLVLGMSVIVLCTFLSSFFGYVAYLNGSQSPITINFPLRLGINYLKIGIVCMMYVTYALNFWAPFNICFSYLSSFHKTRLHHWEMFYRAMLVCAVGSVAVFFPSINALMGVLGTICLSNMAFIWPNLIYMLVIWERPGFGVLNWRLWKALILMLIGLFLCISGSMANLKEFMAIFK